MKPIKAWALVKLGGGISQLKWCDPSAIGVDERALPIWKDRADAKKWFDPDAEAIVSVEIREVERKPRKVTR